MGHFSQMIFYPEERLAVFIDGANLYSAARGLAFDIDYKRLLDMFSAKGRLIRAFYYTALLGPGILADPPARRLARLQRIHDGNQAYEGVHQLDGSAPDQRQHGYRAGDRHARWLNTSIMQFCFPGTAIFGASSRRFSAREFAYRLFRPSGRRRPWFQTICVARPIISSNSRSSRQYHAQPSCSRGAPPCANGTRRRGVTFPVSGIAPSRDCPLCPRLTAFREFSGQPTRNGLMRRFHPLAIRLRSC